MKPLTQLCAAAVLTLALAFSTFAGHAECPGVVDPPPDTTSTATATGEISCGGLQLAVSLIQSVLSLS
jgi:hypothetical protein